MRVFIVLPAFNEADNLPEILEALRRLEQETYNLKVEVVLVDDCSEDETIDVVQKHAAGLGLEVLRNSVHQGLAGTLLRGIKAAAARADDHDVIVSMDADNTHLPGQIRQLIRGIQEGRDVVIASRYRNGAVIRGVPFKRRLLSYGASWVGRLLYPIVGVRDYSCGYRAYSATLLKRALKVYGESLCPEMGFACMVALLINLHRENAIFGEVPIILRYDQKRGHSKIDIMPTIFSTLRLLISARIGRWGFKA